MENRVGARLNAARLVFSKDVLDQCAAPTRRAGPIQNPLESTSGCVVICGANKAAQAVRLVVTPKEYMYMSHELRLSRGHQPGLGYHSASCIHDQEL